MKRFDPMLKSCCFILFLGCSLGVWAQPQDLNGELSENLDKLVERLGLTPEQSDRFVEAMPRQMVEKRALRKKLGDTKRELHKRHRAEMTEILNPDQLLMLDGMLKRRQIKYRKKDWRRDN
jgi:hypothetical protein